MIRELKGLPSLYAVQAFYKVVFGLSMLPLYFAKPFSEFLFDLDQMPPEEQEAMLRKGVALVRPDHEEVFDLLQFATDANGIPYDRSNIKNLGPTEIHECMVQVCLKIADAHKFKLVSEDEKKK